MVGLGDPNRSSIGQCGAWSNKGSSAQRVGESRGFGRMARGRLKGEVEIRRCGGG